MKAKLLIEFFLKTFNERKSFLEAEFETLIEDANDVIYAHNTYKNKFQTQFNITYKDAFDVIELYDNFNKQIRLSKKNTFENQLEKYIVENKPSNKFLICLANYCAEYGFFAFMGNWMSGDSNSNDVRPKSADEPYFAWRKTPKVDIIDFLKLAYALYHSEILTSKSKGITDFVNKLAERLEYPLPKNWPGNLRNGFDTVNGDFDHYKFLNEMGDFDNDEFLEDLREGLSTYIKQRTERKSK